MSIFDPFDLVPLDLPDDLPPDHPLYGVTGIRRIPAYLPYSHWRIKEILRDDFGAELVFLHPGYKGGRYPGYVNKYQIVDIETREIIVSRINLYQIRCVLARNDFPLHAPKDKRPTYRYTPAQPKRNPKAAAFLEAVKRLEAAKHTAP